MKTGVLFSGGKDSCLALFKAREKYGKVDVLLSMIPKLEDAMLWHNPDLGILKIQAKELGIKLVYIKGSNNELEDLRRLLGKVKNKAEVIIGGGIASNYQGKRFTKIIEEEGFKAEFPLWDYTSEELWKEILDIGFKVIITKIACEGIPKEFIGKMIDKERFNKLKELSKKYKFRLDFEGGEAESCVLWMPGFKEEIKIKYEIKSEGEFRHFLVLKEVR